MRTRVLPQVVFRDWLAMQQIMSESERIFKKSTDVGIASALVVPVVDSDGLGGPLYRRFWLSCYARVWLERTYD